MKTIPSLTICSLVTASLLLATYSAQASDITFTPRVSISIAAYEFTQTGRPGALAGTGINGDDFPELTFDVTFKILGIGGTFIKNGYYLDLSAQKSLEEEDSFTLEDTNLPGGSFTENFEGDREDFGVTLGKKILDNKGGVYIGYKMGKSEASGNQGQHLSFEEDGFFIGANYGWAISDAGIFSVNIAFADLDGDLTEKVDSDTFPGLTNPLDINASSDAQGLSYGFSWSSRLTDRLSYSLSVDTKKYTFDNVTDPGSSTESNEFEEKLTSASVSVFLQF